MDKKNDIIQTYRQRKDEFRLPLQEGSWEKLEAELTAGTAKSKSFPYRLWAIAAIGLLCLAGSLTVYLMKQEKEVTSETPTAIVELPIATEKEEESIHIPMDSSVNIPEPVLPRPIVTPSFVAAQKEEQAEEKEEKISPDTDSTQEVQPPNRKNTGPQPQQKTPYKIIYPDKKQHQPAHWAFGVTTGVNNFSGTTGGMAEQSFTDPGPKPQPDDPDEDGNQTKASTGGSTGGSSSDYYYQHHMPVSLSLSVRRSLTNRIAIESGLSYTYLYSDITQKDKKRGSQSLHYLGVPLKINWQFVDKGPLSLYLSGGGMLEYCLSARKLSRTPDISRWQASLHGAVGVQMQIYKRISVFAEPGVAYYFDTGKEVFLETSRTVHPLTFNLQAGLRFSY